MIATSMHFHAVCMISIPPPLLLTYACPSAFVRFLWLLINIHAELLTYGKHEQHI